MPADSWFFKMDIGSGLTQDEGFFDDTIRFKPERLAPLANSYKVTATKNAGTSTWYTVKALGEFGRTSRWWNGRPVFRNAHGWFLFTGLRYHGWSIGPEIGKWLVKSSWSRHDPADVTRWNFGPREGQALMLVKPNGNYG